MTKIKVIVLKNITDKDGNNWLKSDKFEGLELTVKEYKHFDKYKAVKVHFEDENEGDDE